MTETDKDMRLHFEEVTTRNVKTSIEYSKGTRQLVRDLEKEVSNLRKDISSKNETITEMKFQLTNIQMKLYELGVSQ